METLNTETRLYFLFVCLFSIPVPKVEQMDRRLGPLVQEFKDLVYPADYNPERKPAAKRRTGQSLNVTRYLQRIHWSPLKSVSRVRGRVGSIVLVRCDGWRIKLCANTGRVNVVSVSNRTPSSHIAVLCP